MKKKEIVKDLVKFGFFNEYLPKDFTTREIIRLLPQLEGIIKSGKDIATEPITFNIFKTARSRREISVPNICSYLDCSFFIQDNWELLLDKSKSKFSHSPIFIMSSYNNDLNIQFEKNHENNKDNFSEYIELNHNHEISERIKQKNHSFKESIQEKIKISAGYGFRLKVDIQDFYNSLYTHSITWAMCGKEKAKENLSNKKIRDGTYTIADEFDKKIINLKNKETNGIITGPFTSRIFSEIILSNIDQIFEEKELLFRRYVDDYEFYFSEHFQADIILHTIEENLSIFGLTLNDSKTKMEQFPYIINNNLPTYLTMVQTNSLEEDVIFNLLNEAIRLEKDGTKGALKYALKMIMKKRINSSENGRVIASLLLNIIFFFPQNGNLAIDFIMQNKNILSSNIFKERIKSSMDFFLNKKKDHELILCLDLARKLKIYISEDIFISILTSNNIFAKIMVLKMYFFEHLIHINNQIECDKILDDLRNELNMKTYCSEEWMLIHEIRVNKFFKLEPKKSSEKEAIIIDNFFEKLLREEVSFYR